MSELINHGFIHSIYAFDPNNIAIEFSAPVQDVDVSKLPKMKDKQPSAVALEGPEPQPGHCPVPADITPQTERKVYPRQGINLSDNET